jgi:uncharacterized damage-inducible protein DinB
MNSFDVFGNWQATRLGLYQALDQLTDEQLNFVPHAGLWSLGETARHIAEVEAGWLGQVVWRETDKWVSFPAEQYNTIAAVKQLLEEVHNRTLVFLEGKTAADLDQVVDLPWGGATSVGWVIWHVLEHEIHHRGEIYLMLGLQGMEAPDV